MLEITRHSSVQPVDARLLVELVDVYLADVALRNLAQTAVNYRQQLQPFMNWWEVYGPAHDYIITRQSFTEFMAWLNNDYRDRRGHQPKLNTIHSTSSRVRMVLRWLHTSGRLPVDISPWVQVPSRPPTRQRFLSLGECQRLFDACRGNLKTRDQAMLAFLLGTGARRFEAALTMKEDLHFTDPAGADYSGHVLLRKTKRDRMGRGMGRLVWFSHRVGVLLQLHLISDNMPDDPRLLQMTNSAIRLRINQLSEWSGVTVSSHDFRRTFSDWWIDHHDPENTLALLILRLQLGHSVPADDITARHYLDLRNPTKLLERLKKFYVTPVDEIRIAGWE